MILFDQIIIEGGTYFEMTNKIEGELMPFTNIENIHGVPHNRSTPYPSSSMKFSELNRM